MDEVHELVELTRSPNDDIRGKAYQELLQMTDGYVEWADEVWDDLASRLSDSNSYQRTIGLTLLCNLAKSDPRNRLAELLPAILAHTKDEKFITSRMCLQFCWKIAANQPHLQTAVVDHLEKRFFECETEPHANLLRLDIIQSLRKINRNGTLDTLIEKLISSETNPKYQAGYRKA